MNRKKREKRKRGKINITRKIKEDKEPTHSCVDGCVILSAKFHFVSGIISRRRTTGERTRNPLGASVACSARLPVGIQRKGVIVSDTRSAPPHALPALTACVDALTAVWHRQVRTIREVRGICVEQTRIHATRNTRFAVCCFRAGFALLRCKAASRAWCLAH